MQKTKIVFDFSMLKGRIIERYDTLSNFAAAAGIEIGTLSNRLRNKTKWPPDEVVRICAPELLDIPAELIHIYFFKQKF